MQWRRKWQPTPVFLPGDSQGRGSLVGCRLWGCTESDTTDATEQQQQQQQQQQEEVFCYGNLGKLTHITLLSYRVMVKCLNIFFKEIGLKCVRNKIKFLQKH